MVVAEYFSAQFWGLPSDRMPEWCSGVWPEPVSLMIVIWTSMVFVEFVFLSVLGLPSDRELERRSGVRPEPVSSMIVIWT